MIPTKIIAARIAPCRQPASPAQMIMKRAKIQIDMPPLKIILEKLHDENETKMSLVARA